MMPPPPAPRASSRAAKRASRGGANSSRGGSNASGTSRPAAKPARGRRRRITDRSRLMTTLEFTANYINAGLSHLYSWQAECLRTGDVLHGGNLVYSAPTSSGKTLVAEILLLRRVVSQKRKAIVVVPFVSLAREKTLYLQSVCDGSGVRVDGFFGSQAPPGGLQKVDVAICTIEKANNLVNRLMEDGCLHRVGCVVADELHLLGDPRRGYLLEVLLTKLLYMNRRLDSGSERRIQLVAMSATLPNLGGLAGWLSAALYVTEFRPVPLQQFAKLGGTVYDERLRPVRPVDAALGSGSDPDLVLELVLETVTAGHGVLVFCPTKAWCEQLAVNVAAEFCRLGHPGRSDLTAGQQRSATALRRLLIPEQLQQLLDDLRRTPAGLDPALARSIAFGVAFHHAGLTVDERDLLELAFRSGTLRVLVATSTLSSGVNLPARRVIVRSPLQGGALLDLLTYRQMAGRAGRTGTDTHGESILVCRECDRANALHLMTSRLPPISSCLTSSGTASEPLRRAVLEVIVSGVAGSREDVALFASCTLPANGPDSSPEQSRSVPEPPPRDGAVGECLGWLIEHEFVRCAEDGSLSATQLGSAALASSLGPADSLAVIAELQRARRCFVLESELHLVYLVTPVYCGDLWPQMDWLNYLTMLEALPAAERRVAELVSVEQRFIVRALKGTVNPRQPRQAAQLVSHKRFYTALALHELINGAPLRRTADKFGCNRGALQALQQSAATFAGMVTSFCGRLGWRCLELLLDQFQSRLEFGVPPELVPLVRLSLVNGLRARALRRAGMERLIQVANSSAQRVEAALRNATPFQSATDEEADPALLAVSGGTQICVDGCRYIPVAEAAREIVLEARKLVESDLGMTGIAWGTGEAVLDGDSSQSSSDDEGDSEASRRDHGSAGSGKIPPAKDVTRTESSSGAFASLDRPSSNPAGELMATEKLVKSGGHSPEVKAEDRTDKSKPSTDQAPCIGHKPSSGNNSSSDAQAKPSSSTHSEPKSQPAEKPSHIPPQPSRPPPAGETNLSTPAAQRSDHPSADQGGDLIPPSVAQRYNSTSAERRRRRRRLSHALFGRRRGQGSTPATAGTGAGSPCLQAESPEDGPRSPALRTRSAAAAAAASVAATSSRAVTTTGASAVVSSTRTTATAGTCSLASSVATETTATVTGKHVVIAGLNTNSAAVAESTPQPGKLRSSHAVTPGPVPPRDLFATPAPPLATVVTPGPTPDSATASAGRGRHRLSDNEALNFSSQSNTDLFDSFEIDSRSAAGLGSTGKKVTPRQNMSAARSDQSCVSSANRSSIVIYPVNSEEIDFGFDETQSAKKISIRYDQMASANKNEASFKSARDSMGSNLITSAMFEDAFTVEQLNLDELSFKENVSPARNTKEQVVSAASQSSEHHDARLSADSGVRRSARLLRHSRESNTSPAQVISPLAVTPAPVRPAKRPSSSPLFGEECRSSKRISPAGVTEPVRTGHLEPGLKSLTSVQRLPSKGKDQTQNTRTPHSNRQHSKPTKTTRRGGGGSGLPPPTSPTPAEPQRTPAAVRQDCIVPRGTGGPAAWPEVCEVSGPGADWCQLKEASLGRWRRVCLALAVERETPRAASLRRHRSQPAGLALRDGARVTGLAVLGPDQRAFFVSLETVGFSAECRSWLSALLSRPELTVVLHRCRRWLALLPPELADRAAAQLRDPAVAAWLLDPATEELPLHKLAERVLLPDRHLVAAASSGPGQQMAVAAALLTDTVMTSLEHRLKQDGLWAAFTDVEMPLAAALAVLEQAGMPVDGARLQAQVSLLQRLRADLERQAHRLAGRRVSLASAADVGRLLFCELGLPAEPVELPGQDPGTDIQEPALSRRRRSGRGPRTRRGRPLPTNREALLRIRHLHPVIDLVIEWRKLTHVLTMIAQPLQREAECTGTDGSRRVVRGRWFTHTATGRVTMHEPSLQTVPRDFSLTGGRSVSLRSAFVAPPGWTLVSADYCQLELRLLAHLSGESRLQRLFDRHGDPFRLIAAAWTGVNSEQVTDEQRQHTKALCYGIIYGMGERSLAAQMAVSEERAGQLQDTFHRQFPGIRPFLSRVVADCVRQGYVTTLAGRRRYLPDITSGSPAARGAAERQAVNTTVQGSAADLVKRATSAIHRRLRERRSEDPAGAPRLVLHLHDELMYQVLETEAGQVAALVCRCMRDAATLTVPLEVKVKQGVSWDQLTEIRQLPELAES
ncbi:DNA polymerase theta-like [Amphibalanus amphitrite]|uniref:DNA polymerase theta-like n=1 Tax=Amphibalanus amphitrite TaxID=1232801 RepID=UPI001C8FB907|nr:DNA polymerase theta-like [Amphibalanus amphitrite]